MDCPKKYPEIFNLLNEIRSNITKGVYFFLILLFIFSCGSSKIETNTMERQAKVLTEEMGRVLNLDGDQVNKVLTINVLNLGLRSKIKAKEDLKALDLKYREEMKKVLNDDQFELFLKRY